MPFQNILVGVHLQQYHPDNRLPSPTAWWVVEKALWLAQTTGARLTFFSALGATADILPYLDEGERHHVARTAAEAAAEVLDGLVRRAQGLKIEASKTLVHGRPWVELIRQTQRGQHDLLLIGASDRVGGMSRMLFGATAERVIHNCPCPVWVVRPEGEQRPPNILVADDLHPVSERALAVAVDLARAVGSPVHLLHVLHYPLDRLWVTGLPSEREQEYRNQVKNHAREELAGQIARVGSGISRPIDLHLADDPGGLPDGPILECVAEQHIDLLVLGTSDRTGIFATLMSNAAERLLPHLSCGLLAVKPADFVGRVTI